MPMAGDENWVCLGVIAAPHGVRGLVRIRPFTADPGAVAAYGPVTDRETGRTFALALTGAAKGTVTARIEGITDRDQAEAVRGTELWVRREALPETEDEEYYHHDMIGLRAEGVDGAALGEVTGVQNHGAGDLLELHLAGGGSALVPFTRACVPVVDIEGGRVVIDAPPGLMEAGEPRQGAGEGKKTRNQGEDGT